MTSEKSVHVEIAGIHLSVRTDASKDTVQHIVAQIENCLRKVNQNAPNAPLNRRLILVSLLLGEDLNKANETLDTLKDKVAQTQRIAAESSSQKARLEAENKQLNSQLNALKNDSQKLETSIKSLEQQLLNAKQAEGGDEKLRETHHDIQQQAQAALHLIDEHSH